MSLAARPITSPPVHLVVGNFVVERMIYGNTSTGQGVDSVHVTFEIWPMAVVVRVVLGDEQVSMDHFVEQHQAGVPLQRLQISRGKH